MESLHNRSKGAGEWILENIVTLIFIAFTLFGFMVSSGVSVGYFFSELSSGSSEIPFSSFRLSFLYLRGSG